MNIIIALIQKALAAFIAAIMASMPAAEVKEEEPVVVKEPDVVVEQVEPTYYANHVYIDNIDVEIVEVDPSNTYQLQSIVDDPYKGVSYQYYKCTYIGDHSHEGFAMLPYVQVGDNLRWKGKVYKCYYADDNAYLDYTQNIKLSNNQYLYEQEAIALVTCKTDTTRYVRLFKEV